MGHISVPHDRTRDPFEGVCPFHKDCFEGLASGLAMQRRWRQRAETLSLDHPAWDLEADYIAHALANYICTLSPQRIIIGGGVGQNEHLLKTAREKILLVLNGYVQSPAILENIQTYVVPPGLGNRAGVAGALALAQQALQNQ
jgi:fructokinase